MIYEDDLKTKGTLDGNMMVVSGAIQFAGTAREEIQDKSFDAQKTLHKDIKKGMAEGLGDLFYADARQKLMELHIEVTNKIGFMTPELIEKFTAVSNSLKIQPGKCPDPNIKEIDGVKGVING